MDTKGISEMYKNASQRVAATYIRMLNPFCPTLPNGLTEAQQEEMTASQADLHAFFQALYSGMYSEPAQFGLPAAADIYLVVDNAPDGPDKTEVKRVLDRQRKQVEAGLDFLSDLGRQGTVAGKLLTLDPGSAVLNFTEKKNGRAWLQGLELAGLIFTRTSGSVIVSNVQLPNMMPAFKLLAESCARSENREIGRVFFARCDFRALQDDFSVSALNLYCTFKPENAAWASELHHYFTDKNYKANVEIGRMFAWSVKYQGRKSIKATPLFQVEYDERLLNQMRAGIKCASAQRIVPLLSNQSQALQDDFARRVNRCGDCHWCDNHKSLAPVDYEYQGEKRTICWYVNSNLSVFTSETADLVKEYALMHEGLGG